MNGPQVNPGLFVLEAAGGIPTWPGGLTPGPGGLASAAALFSAGRPFVGDSPVRLPAAASPVASPAPVTLPFIAIGFDLSPQEAQFLFALSLLGLGTENAQALGDSLHLAAFDTGGGIDAPEPGTVLLLASGLAGVLLARRRRRA
ncbi:MAG: PEP-CTERM sorting domain-containing protein [Acidobacteria bacterium]|nr:MAG: PEP-CTERM sorting domain-containing protein [Acidobacteriota bacterium]